MLGGPLQFDQRAPRFQGIGQLADVQLTHLIAARAAHQQRDHIRLFDAQCFGVVRQRFIGQRVVQLVLAGNLVNLMQFEPEAVLNRAVQLIGANQRPGQPVQCALQCHAEQPSLISGVARRYLLDDLLVTGCQMVLQGLAKIGNLARALVEHDGLIEKVALKVLADEIDFRPQQFQQLQAIVAGGDQLVKFGQALIELTGHFPEVCLGQPGDPALDVAGVGFTECQARLRRRGGTQQQRKAKFTHVTG
ncbi:hypothetical protein PSA5_28965 [Pseudomonas syringae pv. actinidiae]|nr:hypothetical protein PSA5_28965 [Pseudomonas syringae pv. actinidiae]